MGGADLDALSQQAITAFRKQLAVLTTLYGRSTQDRDFIRWRNTTTEVFKRFLPESESFSRFIVTTFEGGYFEVPRLPDDPQSPFNRGCTAAGACLESAIEHIQMFGLHGSVEDQQVATGVSDDWPVMLMAIEEAQKSLPEDERPHPKVGAVVVKNGVVLGKAHRGEILKSHAEYVALDDKLSGDVVAGATVYTTLEPCTTRKHPKIPCAQRLIDRKVARVVIGMLDPNPDIRGRGDQLLSDAGIETQLFPRELRAQVEDMNRDFIRSQKGRQARPKCRLRTKTSQPGPTSFWNASGLRWFMSLGFPAPTSLEKDLGRSGMEVPAQSITFVFTI